MFRPGSKPGLSLIMLVLFSSQCQKHTDVELTEETGHQTLLLVVNKSENSASLFDADTGEKLRTFATGVGPHEAALHAPSGKVVITNYGTRENPGSSLTVIDLRERRVVRTIGLRRYRRPHGVQFFQNGTQVAVTVEEIPALLIVNLVSRKVEKAIATQQKISHMVVLSGDEKSAYVTNIGSGTLSVLDLENSSLKTTLRLGAGSEGLDLSPDGRELWVANRTDDTISVVDTDTLETVAKLECPSFPIRVRFTYSGTEVLVSNARSGDLALFSVADRTLLARIPMELSAVEQQDRLLQFGLSPVPVGIIVDPVEPRAFIANSNADIVSVIDLTTHQVKGRLPVGQEPDGMALLRLETVASETAP